MMPKEEPRIPHGSSNGTMVRLDSSGKTSSPVTPGQPILVIGAKPAQLDNAIQFLTDVFPLDRADPSVIVCVETLHRLSDQTSRSTFVERRTNCHDLIYQPANSFLRGGNMLSGDITVPRLEKSPPAVLLESIKVHLA
jgi:hypothetical protein